MISKYFSTFFQLVLMILTGLIAFASSIYASLNFREIYHKIHIIFEEEDAFDERCDSKSYNDVNFCVCNIGPARNKTEKVLKFRGKHKQSIITFRIFEKQQFSSRQDDNDAFSHSISSLPHVMFHNPKTQTKSCITCYPIL